MGRLVDKYDAQAKRLREHQLLFNNMGMNDAKEIIEEIETKEGINKSTTIHYFNNKVMLGFTKLKEDWFVRIVSDQDPDSPQTDINIAKNGGFKSRRLRNKIANELFLYGVYKNSDQAKKELIKIWKVLYQNFKRKVEEEKAETIIKAENERNRQEIIEEHNEEKLDKRFFEPTLLDEIHRELDKDHKEDHKEKLGLFITSVSAELPDEIDHQSAALKGDSSSGKDNAIRTVFKHFPQEDNFFLTRATTSTLEDESETVKRIAFSEINQHRDNGVNNEITEVFKQLAEGGINVMKKDMITKQTKKLKTKQKSLFYGSTETESDEELETRYIIIPIKGSAKKNKVVVDNTCDNVSSEDYYLENTEEESWISKGIKILDKELRVIIPFSVVFKEKIKDEDGKEKFLFDYTKERIKRDSKRLFSLTKAITWLHQKQRIQYEKEGINFLLAEPSDFITSLRIFSDFFNLTYSGLDHRIEKTLICIKKNVGKHNDELKKLNCSPDKVGWVLRKKIQDELKISSVNTIKAHITTLRDLGYVETFYDKSNPKAYLISPVNSHINHLSLPITLTGVDRCLTGWNDKEKIYEKHGKPKLESIKLIFLDEFEHLREDKEKKNKKKRRLPGEIEGSIIDRSIKKRIYHKCVYCGVTPCSQFDVRGRPVCLECAKQLEVNGEGVDEEVVVE